MNEHPSPHLRGPVKAAYGFGLAAEGVKQSAFSVFLLFYYQQIVGLDPALCGLALFLSLCIDAVADPAIGVWSDGVKSRLGRRHPFMYTGIVPLALAFYAVFTPPDGLSQALLFTWLLVFASIARFAMALFVIPHQSLVPELTADGGERATLTSLRTVFAWMFGLINSYMAYQVFMHGSAKYPLGLLDPSGYPKFALFGACTMTLALAISALGTQRAALLSQPGADRIAEIPMRQLPRAIVETLKLKSYRASLAAGLGLYVGYGMTENMGNYMNTFFWRFTSDQLGTFIFVIFGASLIVLAIARRLVQRFGNRVLGIASAVLIALPTPIMVCLRLAGVLPDTGDPKLFLILTVSVFFTYSAVIMGMIVIGTMIADITDEYELNTGARQEGLLFSANMFMTKAASGLGTLAAGLLIRVARFPEGASPDTIDPVLVRNLGLSAVVGGLFFGAVMIYYFAQYRLDRDAHARIVRELAERRSTVVPGARSEPAVAAAVAP